jgi:hypothetical protein
LTPLPGAIALRCHQAPGKPSDEPTRSASDPATPSLVLTLVERAGYRAIRIGYRPTLQMRADKDCARIDTSGKTITVRLPADEAHVAMPVEYRISVPE